MTVAAMVKRGLAIAVLAETPGGKTAPVANNPQPQAPAPSTELLQAEVRVSDAALALGVARKALSQYMRINHGIAEEEHAAYDKAVAAYAEALRRRDELKDPRPEDSLHLF